MTQVSVKPILVTGATGFIASHIVEKLLSKNYKVRGTVRKLANKDSYVYLTNFKNASTNLELVEADLNSPTGWKEAVAGCEYVIHTASPFLLNVNDPQKDLVEPAVNGVKFVFEACSAAPEVNKVVLTSSVAAVSDSFLEDKIYNEEDWNTQSSLNHNPYYYSKTLAEKYAHEFMEKNKPHFKLAVINPYATIGPSYRKDVNQSVNTFERFLNGTDLGIPKVSIGYVDVRDVADAHILAVENKDAEGRFILNQGTYLWKELAERCRKMYPKYPIPKFVFPNFLVRIVLKVMYNKGHEDFITSNLGKTPVLDNSKSINILGVKYTDMDKTIKDCCENLIDHGFVKRIN